MYLGRDRAPALILASGSGARARGSDRGSDLGLAPLAVPPWVRHSTSLCFSELMVMIAIVIQVTG